MDGVVMVIRESALQETLVELQDVIIQHGILLRIMIDAEFDVFTNLIKTEDPLEESEIS